MTRAAAGGPTRLVIVDDHAIIRQGLRTMLERDDEMLVVAEAGTPAEARAAVREHRPDVVLLDLKLGDDEDAGLTVCRQLTADDPGVRVLVLTTFLNERLVVEAIRSGAKGYVLKDVDAEALVRSIRAVRAGESAFDSHSAAVVVKSMSGEIAPDPAIVFTARESELIGPRGRRHIDGLIQSFFPLLKVQRAIVEGRRKSKPVFNQSALTSPVASVHAADLRN